MLFIPVFPDVKADKDEKSVIVSTPEAQERQQLLTDSDISKQYEQNAQYLIFLDRIVDANVKDSDRQNNISQVREFTLTFAQDFTSRILQFDDISNLIVYPEISGNTIVYQNVGFFDYSTIMLPHNYTKFVQTYASVIYKALVTDKFLETTPTARIDDFITYLDSKYRTFFVETKEHTAVSYFRDNVIGVKDFIETILDNAKVRIPITPLAISQHIAESFDNYLSNSFNVSTHIDQYMATYHNVTGFNDYAGSILSDSENPVSEYIPTVIAIYNYANRLYRHILQNKLDVEKCKVLVHLFSHLIIAFMRSDYKSFLFDTDISIQEQTTGEVTIVHISGTRNYFIVIGEPESLSVLKDDLIAKAKYDFHRKELEYVLMS